MYLGKVCEVAPADDIFSAAAHPYTHLLLDSVIELGDDAVTEAAAGDGDGATGAATSEPPSALDPPSGCRFRTRCPRADERCAAEEPALVEIGTGHHVACHHPVVETATTAASTTTPVPSPGRSLG
jgi:peptide/nickel transport system ATP-binding protein